MIDYEYWDSINEFTINEASWLWLEEEPKLGFSERNAKYLRTSNLIYEATKSGILKFRETKTEVLEGVYGDGETYIAREELKSFSLNIGQKPKFLFPEMRLDTATDNKQPPDSSVMTGNAAGDWKSKNEREYLLRTIGALSLLLIEKTQGDKFGSRIKPNKAGIYGAIGDILSCMELSNAGQGDSRLNDVLREAIEITMKK
jgi:hypothetical protein